MFGQGKEASSYRSQTISLIPFLWTKPNIYLMVRYIKCRKYRR